MVPRTEIPLWGWGAHRERKRRRERARVTSLRGGLKGPGQDRDAGEAKNEGDPPTLPSPSLLHLAMSHQTGIHWQGARAGRAGRAGGETYFSLWFLLPAHKGLGSQSTHPSTHSVSPGAGSGLPTPSGSGAAAAATAHPGNQEGRAACLHPPGALLKPPPGQVRPPAAWEPAPLPPGRGNVT